MLKRESGVFVILPVLIIAVVLVGVVGFTAYFLLNSSSTTSSQPQTQEDLSREKVFSTLTKNSWCNKATTKGSMFPDYTDYKFKPDGTYKWRHFTDYTPAPSGAGKWNFFQDSAGEWFLLYDDGQRLQFTLNNDKSLKLEDSNLNPCDLITATEKYDASTLPPIQISSSVKLINDKLTTDKWKRANDFDLGHEPTLVEFKKDFEYVTTYRYGECQNGGSWYATEDKIQGKSLTDNCDPRNDTYPESLTAKLLDNGFLFLDFDLYVPENYLLKKGVIWSVPGYSDVVNIKVEYDMPIKTGIPNRFDVEMTNVGEEKYPGPITLERFSITEEYVRNYRNLLGQVDEVAGHDLGSKVLQPGETYKFSLDATFDKTGKQSMYINSLMTGRTQSWDTHQYYSIKVQ